MPNFSDGNVYSVKLSTPSSPTLFSLSGTPTPIEDIAVSGQTAYLAGCDGNVYSLDLTARSYPSLFSLSPIPGPIYAITTSGQTAYLGGSDGNVYRLNISAPSSPTKISTTSILAYIFGIGVSGQKLYLSGNDGNVYSLDLSTPTSPITKITTVAGPSAIDGIAVSGHIGYLGGYSDGNVYSIDFNNPVTPIKISLSPVPSLQVNQIAINGQTVYIVDKNGIIYSLDLNNLPGTLIPISLPSSTLLSFTGIQIYVFINTQILSGNNAILAHYLNNNAPQSTLDLFNAPYGLSYLAFSLEMTAPTRNAMGTFSAQRTQLFFEQSVNDHLCQNRLPCNASGNIEFNCLRSELEKSSQTNISPCRPKVTYTSWLGLFGDFAHNPAKDHWSLD